jgi:hypothetical protein
MLDYICGTLEDRVKRKDFGKRDGKETKLK